MTLRESKRSAPVAVLASKRVKVRARKEKRFSATVAVPVVPVGEYLLVACVQRGGNKGPKKCRASASRVAIEAAPAPQPQPASQPTFTPGSRTLGDPLLPQIGNGGYDALHYAIDLDYDRAANVFDSASTTITARATQNLSKFSLDFQDLPIDSVSVDGAAASFTQNGPDEPLGDPAVITQPMKLEVTLPAGIPRGSEFSVEVDYHGEPRVFVDPDQSLEGWIPDCFDASTVCDSAFVVGEPMGSQAWFPSNNYPSDKATFDTSITVATGEQAFGVGELAGAPVDNGDGTTTWNWTEDDPVSTYLVTATNGDFDYTETTATELSPARTLPVYNALDPSASPTQTDNFTTLVGRDSDLINFLGARYGPYPFDSYGAVFDEAPSVGYALEVATKSHFAFFPNGSDVSGGTASTYLHELSHMWFGDAVTLARWNDIWFNEGWAQLSEWDWQFSVGGTTDSPADRFDSLYNNPGFDWSLAPAVLDHDPANLFDFFPTYLRGAMTLEGFREIVGDAAFLDFAKAIQTEFAYGNISTGEFIAFAKQHSGLTGPQLALLDDYFQQWLYTTTKPTITPADF